MRRVALYGGSFDPPHRGHEAVVKALLAREEIEKVIIMPTFLNPFKESFFAPASLRLAWLREIFENEKRVIVSDFEVKQERKVPTIESVAFLKEKYKEITLVIGADNLASLHKWQAFERLKESVSFLVASRDGIEIPPEYERLEVDVDISSSRLRNSFDTTMLVEKNAQKIEKYYKEKNER